MKTFALMSMVLFCAGLHAQTITSPNTMAPIDWSLAAGTVAGRGVDWASTEQCVRDTARNGCHEALLPNALVHSKAGLAAFETGASGLSIYLQRYETRKGHRRLARIAALFDVTALALTQVNNYKAVNVHGK